jgi:hypothetical protein
MDLDRAQTGLMLFGPVALAAGALVWASRSGRARTWAAWLILTMVFSGVFLWASQGKPMDWPRWGTVLGIALVGLGMVAAANHFQQKHPAPFVRFILVFVAGVLTYFLTVFALVFLAPGVFWI